jgi:DNA-binding response OmpR family regulator
MMKRIKGDPRWILFIEDEELIAETVIDVLENFGFKVVHCMDYISAIQKASNQVFEAMVVDIRIGKGSGEKFVQTIKSSAGHLNYSTPVLIASSLITKDLLESIGSKIDDAIVKPYSMQDLVKNLCNLIGLKSSDLEDY